MKVITLREFETQQAVKGAIAVVKDAQAHVHQYLQEHGIWILAIADKLFSPGSFMKRDDAPLKYIGIPRVLLPNTLSDKALEQITRKSIYFHQLHDKKNRIITVNRKDHTITIT